MKPNEEHDAFVYDFNDLVLGTNEGLHVDEIHQGEEWAKKIENRLEDSEIAHEENGEYKNDSPEKESAVIEQSSSRTSAHIGV